MTVCLGLCTCLGNQISNLFDGDAGFDVVLESDGGERVDGGGDGAQRAGEDPGDEEA